MTKLTCVVCGKEFEGNKNWVCCSRECRRIRNLELVKKRTLAEREVKTCVNCGKVLEPTVKGERRAVKFCSDECRSEHYSKMSLLKKPKAEEDKWKTKCERKTTCIYGQELYSGCKYYYCAYLEITGKVRGGNPKDCTHYRKR